MPAASVRKGAKIGHNTRSAPSEPLGQSPVQRLTKGGKNMKRLTLKEKHLLNQTIKKLDSIRLERWFKDSKRWRKNWAKKVEL